MAQNFSKNGHVDVYQMVTDRILEMMSNGVIPWNKPWHGGLDGAISYTTGKPYSLLNQMLLGKDGEYLTFKQVESLGGKVKKGAKAQMVVFFKQFTYKDFQKGENGEMVEVLKTIPVLRYYNVFHIEDCDGVQSKFSEKPTCTLSPIEAAEKIVTTYYERESCELHIRKSDKAYYSPSLDEVVVPLLEQYDSESEYYSTLFHESVHSTGHRSRLNRDEIQGSFFGSDPYAKEELVAELGAAFLCHTAGIDCNKTMKNSAAYIQSWSKRFKENKKLIVSAASRAEKAVKFILGE